MANYSPSSPYFTTEQDNGILQPLNFRSFAFETDDMLYKIDSIYDCRPDLLAHDQYADARLWWVFMHRNPDVILDPIWDFRTGAIIRLPKLDTLKRDLGI
jgi:hypothetical protein